MTIRDLITATIALCNWKDRDVGLMTLSKSHLPLALDGLASFL
jgi:hypothetical protein